MWVGVLEVCITLVPSQGPICRQKQQLEQGFGGLRQVVQSLGRMMRGPQSWVMGRQRGRGGPVCTRTRGPGRRLLQELEGQMEWTLRVGVYVRERVSVSVCV